MLNLFQHLIEKALKQVQGDGRFTCKIALKKICM